MSQVIEVSVSAGSDDAEEVQGTGQVFVNSSDLELVDDADYVGQQTVGIRFDGLDIRPARPSPPPGSSSPSTSARASPRP